MKNKIVWIVSVLALLFTGCGSSTQEKISQSSVKNSELKVFNINVNKGDYLRSLEQYNVSKGDMVETLKEEIEEYYPNSHFKFDSDSQEGININLVIRGLNYVSGSARFLTGSMSGSASLKVKVIINDAKSNKTFEDYTFSKHSSKWDGIFGGTTSSQIKDMSKEIVTRLKQHNI